MAAAQSGDCPGNGAIEGQQDGIVGEPGMLTDDQTRSDRDQTLSDADQTGSDRDQTASDRDQSANDRDQLASDRELAHGGDAYEHDLTRGLRVRSSAERRQSARQRVESASDRDVSARTRDMAALARDQTAAVHDRELAERDRSHGDGERRAVTGVEVVMRAAAQRRSAAADRVSAAEGRERAAADREHAARDREQAARDRLQAQADRELLLTALEVTEIDPLTGARTRAAGLRALDHEIERAHRTTGLLSIAYVDLVGLEALDESLGHAAGDALLSSAVADIRAHLRSYDLIIRLGSGEFLCAMSNVTLGDAGELFSQVAAALTATSSARGIRTGFAQLKPSENAAALIARAERELVDGRPHRP